jgi:hypothetical protein
MHRSTLMDEFHLTLLIPSNLPDSECRTIRRTLARRQFQAALTTAVRRVLGRYSSLRKVRVRLSR